MVGEQTPTDTDVDELIVTRIFDAPRKLVWRAWTDPEHVKRWWGPRMFTAPHCTIDLRPGGAFHAAMQDPDGKLFWSKGIYQEIVEPERLVSTDYFSDAEGNRIEPSAYGLPPGFPAEMIVTVTFEDVDGKTRVTVHQTIPAALAKQIGAFEGWNGSLDKLAEHLETLLGS
jgi:uncharacterized protein YndB with AHSA1/START domain